MTESTAWQRPAKNTRELIFRTAVFLRHSREMRVMRVTALRVGAFAPIAGGTAAISEYPSLQLRLQGFFDV